MKTQDKISKFCSFGEATISPTAIRLGIDNTPNEEQLAAMKYVAVEIFDKVREHLNAPLSPTSFFRAKALNTAIGGSSTTSQHMKGEAIDMVKEGRNKEIFDFIRANLDYDQIVWEYGDSNEPAWVHCSKIDLSNPLNAGRKNRKQALRCYGNAQYVAFDLY